MKKKILVVDDSEQMLEFMTSLLEEEGHEVITAQDGFSALNMLISFIPDIMFVDLVMPIISGDKLCKIVRKMQHLHDCHLVLVTAAAAELEFDFTELGVDTCIAKGPYGSFMEHVLTAIKEFDSPQKQDTPKSIMGLEEVYPRRMTKELLSRNRSLETILESMGEGILEVYSGKIVYANAAAASLCGVSQEELLATYFVDLFEPSDRPRVNALLAPGTGKFSEVRPGNAVKLNSRQVTIKNFTEKHQASTSIILITDVTNQNILEFQEIYGRKMEICAAMADNSAKAFQKQLQWMQQTTSGLLEEMDPGNRYLKKIQTLDRHNRKMADLIHQLSLLTDIEKIMPGNMNGSIQSGTETILLVDNEVIIRQVNRLALEELGYRVLVAATGKGAIEKYRVRSDKKYNKIDMVIVDSHLPDMDTGEFCDRLTQIKPGVKILISGEPNVTDQDIDALLKIVSGFTRKPFHIRQVSSKLREILDKP